MLFVEYYLKRYKLKEIFLNKLTEYILIIKQFMREVL